MSDSGMSSKIIIAENKDEKWVHKHCAEDIEGLP